NAPIVNLINEEEQTLSVVNTSNNVLDEYSNRIKVDRNINANYFKKAYLSSFFIFLFSFILFYLLTSKSNSYLLYIIVCLILYPLTKAVIDLLYGFKYEEFIENNTGPIYHVEKLKLMFDLAWFHISFFLAPLSILILLIRYGIIRRKQRKETS